MKFITAVAGVATVLAGLLLCNPLQAQSPPAVAAGESSATALGVSVAETQLLVGSYRASRLRRADVFNEKGEKVGRVDDLLIAPDGSLSIAVIDVGGFLGLGKHLVAIPVRQFKHIAPKAVLPGASRESLKALPKFEYAA
ncbi:PRC-barrel domain-containing protein [Eleftheria terrae]|uniref:PRC-barrel domain-containing protein n=1 Tax=Eleftheria terrae TaxID=1597781 RepID=UPI00263A6E93|nr:PRC-barrel domain-containing protein [Eleftheria terrae]WKB52953.1 PRC-barrel domain-containing protein [Eleftheria terrae]